MKFENLNQIATVESYHSPEEDIITRLVDRMIADSSREFKMCLLAGVGMDTSHKKTDDGITVTIRTKDPVAIVGDTVYIKKTVEPMRL
jgi:hypothetical protein